jgi:glycosyltransferase involved in cell wall biosynthesis
VRGGSSVRRSGGGQPRHSDATLRPVPQPEAAPQARIVVVMPAYNAAETLSDTYRRIPPGMHGVILVDDGSRDQTVEIAASLGIKVIRHPHNVGYGGNQKTCYMEALRDGADVVVMLHPDGQYDPELIFELVRPIVEQRADMVLGSRFLRPLRVRESGMPGWKIVSNRFLTTTENLAMGTHFAECHTGYRAYSADFLRRIPFLRNSNDFVFDTQVIAQAVAFGQRVAEVPARTRYFPGASSISFAGSVRYGLQTLATMLRFLALRFRLTRSRLFEL